MVTIIEHDREELVATLRQELALRNREISRLHDVIASQANAIAQATAALPATTGELAESDAEPVTNAPGSPRANEAPQSGLRGYVEPPAWYVKVRVQFRQVPEVRGRARLDPALRLGMTSRSSQNLFVTQEASR